MRPAKNIRALRLDCRSAMTSEANAPLWTPSAERIERAAITRYLAWLKQHRNLSFSDYESLWQWSTTEIEAFWETVWQFGGVISHAPYERVLDKRVMPGAKWFEGATLNYAEHALAYARQPGAKAKPAIIFQSELVAREEISWGELAEKVGALAVTLVQLGVESGDRIVGYLPNIPQATMALLAGASQGAIWSCTSPDMGPVSVLDRFRQIAPKVLVTVDGYRYGGKDIDRRDTVRELVRQLPSVQSVIFVRYLDRRAQLDLSDIDGRRVQVIPFEDAIARPAALEFKALPFSHPLWVVYSSGTTGMPKPIVHGHGGTVLQTLKSGLLHFDAKPGDRSFWFTSTTWIMWNSLVNGLINGATILQIDGNPGYPDLTTLWRFAERERADSFGTSPAFINMCMKAGLSPRRQFDLSSLRTIGCTGSPLTEEGFRWVYEHVHPDAMLACISGGTDPAACFLTSCPTLPIYTGEMTCRELGVATYAFDDIGKPIVGEVGELVMTQPIPSLPLFFWGDTDGKRYRDSYFDVYPGVWRHGDWLKLIERPQSVTGIIYGRSDSTINRLGIRMGTSEIYRIVEEFPEVLDSLAVDLEYLGKESYLALFVVLRETAAVDPTVAGRVSRQRNPTAEHTGVPAALRSRLFDAIRSKVSARHVPSEAFAIAQVPRTLSGKKLEVPVRKILLGQPIERSLNRDAMANPATVDWFVEFAKARTSAAS
jgi:acetoacetyl-CoA synthetase